MRYDCYPQEQLVKAHLQGTQSGSQPDKCADREDEEGAFKFNNGDSPSRFEKWRKGLRKWIIAYSGSLMCAAVAFPIVASAATVCFYFSPGSGWLSVLLPNLSTSWNAPLSGLILAVIATFLFALLRCYFATAEGANRYCYGQLRSRQSQLKARLGIRENKHGMPSFTPLRMMKRASGWSKTEGSNQSALRDAYTAYEDVCHLLCQADSGLQWVTGAGYLTAWELIHRAEEALIEVEPVETIVREARHDQQALENSSINNCDSLLERLTEAFKVLVPSDTPTKSADKKAKRRVRGVLRDVRHTLNTYRDSKRQGLVRLRNHLLTLIALTGVTTYMLLCIPILLDQHDALLAATAFYLIGTVTGLFGRLYHESSNHCHITDDYGLFTARLIAIPLLSGLAGIGGVFVMSAWPVLSGNPNPYMSTTFTLTLPSVFAAALFGFTPNLLIKSFQQRTQEYESALKSSEASGTVAPH